MQLPNLSTKKYIIEHQHDNLKELLLKKRHIDDVDYEFAYRQIAGRQRIKHKLPEFYNNVDIIYPHQINLEQSSSESTALYKKTICEGSIYIDITGGFGIDFYYISECFKEAIYVERNQDLFEIVTHNLKVTGRENTKTICDDALNFIPNMPVSDFVMVDPARRDNSGGKVVLLSDCEPDITQIYKAILNKTNALLVKLSPMLDISAALNELSGVCEVHVVSVENECKEILLLLKNENQSITKYFAVNILKNNTTEKFVFTKEEESDAKSILCENVLTYLYEPNSSVLKAGAFKCVSQHFGLEKLHLNTHLYTSDKLISNFPGRRFKVLKVWPGNKSSMKEMGEKLVKANISTRNHPLKPDEIKKKTGIADGGDTYLFACSLKNEVKVYIECEKITSEA